PPFICSADTLTNPNPAQIPTAYISALRTGAHDKEGYERLAIDFSNGRPDAGVQLKPQNGTSFDGAPSGQTTKVKGTNGIKVIITGSDMHTSYQGKLDIVTSGYSKLVEIRQIEDFEGYVQLAIGVNGAPCYRAFYTTN